MRLALAVTALGLGITMANAQTRFPVIQPEQMNAEQKKLFDTLVSGPRAQNYGGEDAKRVLSGGPFNAWMRSPEAGLKLQDVGAHIRFKSSLPKHLNELAILVTAREWTSQYEWYAHKTLALKAGLDGKIIDAIAAGKRPEGMKDDEAAIYDFCIQLHHDRKVDDGAFDRVKALFGEQGVIDLVVVSGYYVALSMTLNVAQVPVPDGSVPLKPVD